MFMGEFKHNIDVKGRLIMPVKFRDEMGDRFIVTRGLDGCLFGYSLERWASLHTKAQDITMMKKQAREFLRFLYTGATEVELDKQGRINLPQSLVEYAGLSKECRVVGVSDRLEIWSEEKWKSYLGNVESNIDDITESIDFDF